MPAQTLLQEQHTSFLKDLFASGYGDGNLQGGRGWGGIQGDMQGGMQAIEATGAQIQQLPDDATMQAAMQATMQASQADPLAATDEPVSAIINENPAPKQSAAAPAQSKPASPPQSKSASPSQSKPNQFEGMAGAHAEATTKPAGAGEAQAGEGGSNYEQLFGKTQGHDVVVPRKPEKTQDTPAVRIPIRVPFPSSGFVL